MNRFVFALLFSCVFHCFSKVVELTDKDFGTRLRGQKALIMFYSPNCGHCKQLKPTYEKLGTNKEIIHSGVVIGKVDCTAKGQSLCGKYKVNGYPTVKFLSGSEDQNPIDYEGNRQLDDLVQFVLENSRPKIRKIEDKEVKDFIKSNKKPTILGLFKDDKSMLYKKLVLLSSSNSKLFDFGFSFSEKMAEKLGHKLESVVFFRQNLFKSPIEPNTAVESSADKLDKFLSDHSRSLVEIRTPKNEESFSKPLIVVFLPIDPTLQVSQFRRIRNNIVRLAQKLSEIQFSISLNSAYGQFLAEFAPNSDSKDIFLLAYDSDGNKYKSDSKANIDDHKSFAKVIEKFAEDFQKGGVLERYIKSQEIPRQDSSNVQLVVAKNFEQVVLDESKDVLIEFFAPWCGHCKKLDPIYKKLATLLKDETDHLIIAKMDATANEVHKDFEVNGFPTIYLSRAGKKSKPIMFDGTRTVAGILEWLKKHVTHPIKYSGQVTEPKDEL